MKPSHHTSLNQGLWKKLSIYQLNDPASLFSFSDRLARENSWSPEYTARVIEEYKRFIYLCAEAGHPVTPSDEVDQVWHLHLCYTRSYWHDLCRDILEKPIHHGPTAGGKDERKKYNNWYEETIRSYQEHFASTPPEDIWPKAKKRFGPSEFCRIDKSRNWVISHKAGYRAFAGLGAALLLASCSTYLAALSEIDGFVVFVVLCAVVIAWGIVKIFKGSGGGGAGGGCGGAGGSGGGIDSGGDSGCGGGGCGGGCGGG